jgi:two-component system sensor histidine kinase VicK
MRWWLALAFAGIAALTALAVAQVFTARSEAAIRERAQELVAGTAVAAAAELPQDATAEEVRRHIDEFAAARELALFAFGPDQSLVSTQRMRGIDVLELPNLYELLATALDGRRAVETIDDGRLVTVALPMRRDNTAALIAVSTRSDLEDALGIVRDQIVSAALWATGLGAVAGLVVALLITRRIRRIADTAADIERGHFDDSLQPRFPDELGSLAHTIDNMRRRLRSSFDQLESERDRLSRLLEQLQEGVVAVNSELVVEFANSRARELIGSDASPGTELPEPWAEPSLRGAARRLFEPGAQAAHLRATTDSGRAHVVALLPPSVGSKTGVVVVTDVTDQERRERAEREFVTNAAHELRTPLAAIASAVEVLQHGGKENAEDRDRFLAVVERQTERLSRLAHALLTLARAQTRSEPVRVEPVAVLPLAHEVADPVGASVDCPDALDGITVLAHRDLLLQALENVTANALKHAPDAPLSLRVQRVGPDTVKIDVTDGGPGMTATQAQRALDRFYRSNGTVGDGFGLGLPIAREALNAMGGTIAIGSKEGVGTTVSICLPEARVGSRGEEA